MTDTVKHVTDTEVSRRGGDGAVAARHASRVTYAKRRLPKTLDDLENMPAEAWEPETVGRLAAVLQSVLPAGMTLALDRGEQP